MKFLRMTAVVVAFAGLLLSELHARVDGFPGIPGVPGVPGVNPQQVAINAAARQLTPWVAANQPIIHDWQAVYPTVARLPGSPFSPIKDPSKWKTVRASVLAQLAHSNNGVVRLPPGDYAFATRVYCTSWYAGNIHRGGMGHRGIWLLGPLRGSRADILAAMYARASGKDLPFSDVQTLSWAIQAGMRYDDFPTRSQQLVNQLIPEFKDRLAGSFTDQVQSQWDKIADSVPNLPSFDSAIGSMGDVGGTILGFKGVHDEIVADADNFDALRHGLAPPGGQDDENVGPPPWSVVSQLIYERLITEGSLGTNAVFEIRVMPKTSMNSNRVVASAMLDDREISAVNNYLLLPDDGIPFEPIAYPPNHPDWQPLTQDSPTLGGGWGDEAPQESDAEVLASTQTLAKLEVSLGRAARSHR